MIFCGGGTMGHVMVHLCVYPYLKDFADKFYYIGSRGGVEKTHVQNLFEYREIDAVKFDRSKLLKIFSIPFKLSKAVSQAKKILEKAKPSVVFCGGGYVCVPVAIAAKKLKIPVILHESDLTVGLANRISLRFCEKILTTFPETLQNHQKSVYCGAPVRKELFFKNRAIALRKMDLKGEKPVLLVIGGSKGSAALNRVVEKSLENLLKKYEVLHICGSDHTTDIKADGYRQFPYIEDMAAAYAASDLALSRCGSNTAFELISLGIPTLFVPLSKKASRGDQIENAAYFENKNLACVVKEENLSENNLPILLSELVSRSKRLKANMKNFALKGADERIAEIIKKYLQ